MVTALPFTFDEAPPNLNYFQVKDGTYWCHVKAYKLHHTIGPYSSSFACETAAKAQIELQREMALLKAQRGDLEVALR